MSIVNDINSDYGNVNDMYNPILKDILSELDSFGMLDNLEVARKSETDSIKIFKNLDGKKNKAAPLEIIIDCISRGLMKSYLEGFEQGLSSDGASNISFKLYPEEFAPLNGAISFEVTNNTHQAIFQLAQEIALIKNGIKALGVVIPPVPPTYTPQITLK
jgi:hypothetical protein